MARRHRKKPRKEETHRPRRTFGLNPERKERTQVDEDREEQLSHRSHSPVAPVGDPDGLDDVHRHLEEKDKEEEEEAEGAVGPEEEKTFRDDILAFSM